MLVIPCLARILKLAIMFIVPDDVLDVTVTSKLFELWFPQVTVMLLEAPPLPVEVPPKPLAE